MSLTESLSLCHLAATLNKIPGQSNLKASYMSMLAQSKRKLKVRNLKTNRGTLSSWRRILSAAAMSACIAADPFTFHSHTHVAAVALSPFIASDCLSLPLISRILTPSARLRNRIADEPLCLKSSARGRQLCREGRLYIGVQCKPLQQPYFLPEITGQGAAD